MDKFVISTGNILNVNKKAGQKTAEEVSVTYFFFIDPWVSARDLCDEIVLAVKEACVFCCAYWDKAKVVNYVFWFHNGEYSVYTELWLNILLSANLMIITPTFGYSIYKRLTMKFCIQSIRYTYGNTRKYVSTYCCTVFFFYIQSWMQITLHCLSENM